MVVRVYERKLPRKYFEMIQQRWGRRKIDAFAARHNRQLPIFWSLNPDPEAAATDAFRQQLPLRDLYIHPPWKLIPKALQMFNNQKSPL